MWQTLMISLLAGVLGGNGLPHFIRGITRRRYPCALGNGPIPNLIAGWTALVLAMVLLQWADYVRHPWPAFAAVAAGVLLIGLFHAGPGAFGRRDETSGRVEAGAGPQAG
ncbi:hypothetical protein GCM10010112_66220 [Actinoplanes lobatus]|uniref:Uncharacterized protein n=1 Tax=Actinoplanes lobatus TaxID=113568 RepID=A0A7W7HJW5_9ACTN|nr:hypothetical protein [Actinoplanes lobatus]MBB4751902.1 hypothetical protein [Actinoplanes lobatus]GGN85611.1 hypothetical protein GCM10010112_66220 [Actinoplanes lobatus]GIE44371.1 hypothetical protein Alo02nite_72690 [Actinoplanes lobatus]